MKRQCPTCGSDDPKWEFYRGVFSKEPFLCKDKFHLPRPKNGVRRGSPPMFEGGGEAGRVLTGR